MRSTRDDVRSTLGWAVRRHAGALSAMVVLLGAVFLASDLRARSLEPRYEAKSLIVASRLELPTYALHRLVEAVFRGGPVAQRAVVRGRLPVEPVELIPEHARVDPLTDTRAATVVGIASEPREATRFANSVSQALAAELRRGHFGVFTVQRTAQTPTAPVPVQEPPVVTLLVCAITVAALVAGVIGLFVARRRPVVSTASIGSVASLPVMGRVSLPARTSESVEDATRSSGLLELMRRLFPDGRGSYALVSDERARWLRGRVARAMGRVVSDSRPGVVVSTPSAAIRSDASAIFDGDASPHVEPSVPRLLIIAEGVPSSALAPWGWWSGAGAPLGAVVVAAGPSPQERVRRAVVYAALALASLALGAVFMATSGSDAAATPSRASAQLGSGTLDVPSVHDAGFVQQLRRLRLRQHSVNVALARRPLG